MRLLTAGRSWPANAIQNNQLTARTGYHPIAIRLPEQLGLFPAGMRPSPRKYLQINKLIGFVGCPLATKPTKPWTKGRVLPPFTLAVSLAATSPSLLRL